MTINCIVALMLGVLAVSEYRQRVGDVLCNDLLPADVLQRVPAGLCHAETTPCQTAHGPHSHSAVIWTDPGVCYLACRNCPTACQVGQSIAFVTTTCCSTMKLSPWSDVWKMAVATVWMSQVVVTFVGGKKCETVAKRGPTLLVWCRHYMIVQTKAKMLAWH